MYLLICFLIELKLEHTSTRHTALSQALSTASPTGTDGDSSNLPWSNYGINVFVIIHRYSPACGVHNVCVCAFPNTYISQI